MRFSTLIYAIFCFFQGPTLYGQWEPINAAPNVVAKLNLQYNYNQFLKSNQANVMAISGNSLFVSNDKGVTWSKRDLSETNTITMSNCILTSNGIYTFNVIRDTGYVIGKNAILFSPNFGRTWQTQLLKSNFEVLGQPQFYTDSVFVYSVVKEKLYYQDQEGHTRIFKSKLGANLWLEDSTQTYNRIDTTYLVYSPDSSRSVRRDTTIITRKKSYFAGIDTKRVIYKTPDSLIVIDRKDPLKSSRIALYGTGFDIIFNDSINVMTGSSIYDSFIIGVSQGSSVINSTNLFGKWRVVLTQNEIYIYTKDGLKISKDKGRTYESFLDQNDGAQKFFNREIKAMTAQDSFLYVLVGNNYIYRLKKGEKKWTFCFSNITLEGLLKPRTGVPDIKKLANNTLITTISYGNENGDTMYDIVFSQDDGKTWQPFEYTPKNTKQNFNYLVHKNDIYFNYYTDFRDSVYKTSDLGKTWQIQGIFPKFKLGFSNQDTMVVYSSYYGNIQTSVYPFSSWRSVPGDPNIIAYEKGILYYTYYDFLKRVKLDGTELSLIKLPVYPDNNIIITDGKIFVFQKDSNLIKRTTDNGTTWKTVFKSKNQNISYNINFFFKVLSNGVLLISDFADNTCCKNYGKYGGIYVSTNDGDTWKQANENLYPYQPYFGSAKWLNGLPLTELNQYIYYDYWRRKIDDFKFQSIAGNVYLDKNNNGQKDAGEIDLKDMPIVSKNAGNYTISDSLGLYSLFVDTKITDTLTVVYDNKYVKVNPQFRILKPSDTTTLNQNFGIFLLPNVVDVKINLTATTPPRSGFENEYILTYKNTGSTIEKGDVTLTYHSKQNFIIASTAPSSNLNQILTWPYINLQPNESRTIKLTLRTAVDAVFGSQVQNVATITPISKDTVKVNNIDSLNQIVVNAFDPNDKQVSFINSKIQPTLIDTNTELIYTIRFQNTGNYPASFVRITDTLSDKFDINSLRVLAASHAQSMSIKEKKVLSFDFNPIYLPDSSTNEKDSHGFVKFAIKPKKNLTKDEIIKNTAHIFFDYNSAVVTNTVETSNLKNTKLFTLNVLETFQVYPNPAKNVLFFKMDTHLGEKIAANVYAIDGKLMFSKQMLLQVENVLNTEILQGGLYIIDFKIGVNQYISKFFIEK
jgi:uncharacterized repeat protein (TIGR01451 family)